MFKRILVPLDGSNLAERVLPFSSYLAEQLQATLILFHVVEKDAPGEIHGQTHLHEVSEAKAYLDRIAGQFTSPTVKILQDVHEVQEAGVAKTIRDHAEELDTDLVVLCAHGNGGLRDMFFGSIGQQVIRHGNIPVLFIRPETVQGSKVTPIRQILVPLDGSPSHEGALQVAADLAKKLNAKIRLLTVIPSPETLSLKDAISSRISPRTANLTLDFNVKQAEAYLLNISQELSKPEIPVSGLVARGDVPSMIHEIILEEGIDLMVMVTHGHSAIDAHWEGSLTPRFLPKTPIPVILVRGEENQD